MRLLLDTHVLFWWLTNEPRLSPACMAAITEMSNEVFVSAASAWEIAVKVRIGKWPEAAHLVPGLEMRLRTESFSALSISVAEAERAGGLDLFHRDPFDRLIAAQALAQGLTVASVDPVFARFGCSVLN